MEMKIEKINYFPDPEKLAEKYSIEKDDYLYEKIVLACEEISRIGKPVVCFKKSTVDSAGEDYVIVDGIKFSGKFIAEMLCGCKEVYPFIASCGPELDCWGRNTDDIMLNYCLDDLRQASIKPVLDVLRKRLEEDFGACKLSVVNPGSIPNWPISEQKKLFELMGPVYERIGVRLDDTMLMYPLKSVSGIYFEHKDGYCNCRICKRNNCPSRREKFNEEEMIKMLDT